MAMQLVAKLQHDKASKKTVSRLCRVTS